MLRQRLLDNGVSEEKLVGIEQEVEDEVASAIEFAESSPWPDITETYTDVFAPNNTGGIL